MTPLQGAEYLKSPVFITPSRASKSAIEAIEKNGGKLVCVYHNPLALRDCVKGRDDRLSAAPTRRQDISTSLAFCNTYTDNAQSGTVNIVIEDISLRILSGLPVVFRLFKNGGSFWRSNLELGRNKILSYRRSRIHSCHVGSSICILSGDILRLRDLYDNGEPERLREMPSLDPCIEIDLLLLLSDLLRLRPLGLKLRALEGLLLSFML